MNMELKNTIKLDQSWLQELGSEFEKQYMKNLKLFLQSEKTVSYTHLTLPTILLV